MSDLSLDGKALVQAGRQADRPSPGDRERVLEALRARLGDAAVLATGLAHAPVAAGGASAARSMFAKWVWLGPTVLVMTGALWFVPRLWRGSLKAVPGSSATVRTVSTVNGASPANAEPKVATTASGVAAMAPSPSASIAGIGSGRTIDAQKAALRSGDGLAEEVALLSRAETALRAGRPASALIALGEHQRRFPHGALTEERTAARIQALCALGRNDEANAQLKQLSHISPNSAQEERARQACRDPRATP